MGTSKRERKEIAERSENAATEWDATARQHRTEAAAVCERERTAYFKDPEATQAIARHEDANARISEANARDLRASAKQLRKPWWR